MPLDLKPNDIVGYRFSPDWYSVNVVIVKRYGPNSKRAGQEYTETIAHCRDVEFAARWLFQHAIRVRGAEEQARLEALDDSVASTKALMTVVEDAKVFVLEAAAELQARIDALGVTRKGLVKALGGQDAGDAPDDENADAASTESAND